MSSASKSTERRRVRLFIAAHSLAVALVYGLALAVGGGIAGQPFPPDERLALSAKAATNVAGRPGPTATQEPRTESRADLPGGHDIDPPWSFDDQGAVRFRSR
jgi:hypothetical protein